jgi:Ser/Thr protein kinase RdoA (MazF antagonist)
MLWTVETLNHLVDAEIEALPPLLNARLIRLMEMVENVTTTGRRIVILHAFVKKSDKTPRSALETARKRMKEVKP